MPGAAPSVFDAVKALSRPAQSMIASFEALSAKRQNSEGWIEFIEGLEITMAALSRIDNQK